MKNNWRINFILFIIILLGAGLVSRLFFLQVLNRKLYESQALGQNISFAKIEGPRGEIFCENSQKTRGKKASGETKGLALNKYKWTVSATVSQIENKQVFSQAISKELGVEENEIISMLDAEDPYVTLKKDVDDEHLEKIKALGLKGIYWQQQTERFYPQGEMASHLLGFVGGEQTGQYGIEGYYEDILKGKDGIKQEQRGLASIFSPVEVSLNGSDIYLTIDYNIQFQAEQLLKKAKENLDIDSGQIIVMKPDSGRILAMADYPFFNPNSYSKSNIKTFQNSTVQKLFEPGSIMKPFVMAIALNEGKITPEATYEDLGILKYGTKAIHNFDNKVYGKQTMTQVLENSINTGAVYAQKSVSNTTFLNYLDKFSFFKKTGIDLQGEVYSRNESLQNGSEINFATASFGQGIEMTPIQMASSFCALANGGKVVKPFVVDKIVNGKDEVYTQPQLSDSVVSQYTVSQLTSMLISVVDNGFNSVAKIPGYYLAGKTGTAQVPLQNGKGYEPDKTIQSFVGFGPALDPEFLILVKLDDPKVSKSSLSAVPIFKELSQFIINYWQIPPDYEAKTE